MDGISTTIFQFSDRRDELLFLASMDDQKASVSNSPGEDSRYWFPYFFLIALGALFG